MSCVRVRSRSTRWGTPLRYLSKRRLRDFALAALLVLSACAEADETAKQACANAACPPGTVIDLSATSASACEGSVAGGSGLVSADGEVEGTCFSTGSCTYACYPTTKCCGNEAWTTTSYTCETPCCDDGEPPPCDVACGNGICESGEVCQSSNCLEGEDCRVCAEDCCAVCGDGVCEWPEDPESCPGDCSCKPTCAGHECGPDGCGGECGLCPVGEICNTLGQCIFENCEPQCTNKVCGDDGCGSVCGVCPDELFCDKGLCVTTPCVPDCAGKACGDDGCGGSCGTCPTHAACEADQSACVCEPAFTGESCDECADPAFTGTNCDTCSPGYYPEAICDTFCDDDATCGLHGACDDEGVCDCVDGWAGGACQLCDEASPATCDGHGSCVGGACSCEDAWTGQWCDTCAAGYYPAGVCDTPCTANETCSGNGTCSPLGECVCQTAWTGAACDQCATDYYPPGVCDTLCQAESTCNGHGTCDANGLCVCEASWQGAGCQTCADGYYPADVCDTYCDAATTCSGNGTCDATGGCSCDAAWDGASCKSCAAGFTGLACDQCLNDHYDPQTDCVDCLPTFTGPACESCAAPNTTGADCDQCTTGYYPAGQCDVFCDADITCNSRGVCKTDGACACDTGWDGAYCNVCAADYYPDGACDVFCQADVQCSGNGVCADDGTCACDTGWDGVTCTQCAEGFAGAACDTCAQPGGDLEQGCAVCMSNWTGDECDTCANGWTGPECGECPAELIGLNCTCPFGWTGSNCETCSNYALNFGNDNEDLVEVPDSDAFSFGDGQGDSPFSISAWVLLEDVHDSIIVSKFGSGAEWTFGFTGDDRLALALYPGEQLAKTTQTQEILEGTWHHVAGTYNGLGASNAASGIKLYIDGVLQDDISLAQSPNYTAMAATDEPVRIGIQGGNDFKGSIDEVRIWSRELSEQEIADKLAKKLNPEIEDGLVGYWKFDEGIGNTAYDSSGNGHHGSIEGATWIADCVCDPTGFGSPACSECPAPWGGPDCAQCWDEACIATAFGSAAFTCSLASNGAITCTGEYAPTPPTGSFRAISASNNFLGLCGLSQTGEIICSKSNPPEGTYTVLSAGNHHNCAIRDDGQAICWGTDSWDNYGQSSPPPGTYKAIAAGLYHSCALNTEGHAICWGCGGGLNGSNGQCEDHTGPFIAIATGHTHSCALDSTGNIECWGENDLEQCNPPPGTYRAITAGWSHTCALTTAGKAVCWGNNNYGQADPVDGSYTAISSGHQHTCALDFQGELVCWGNPQWY